jgi:hypothetical protein
MTEPWHVARPELRSEIERSLAATQPGLRVGVNSTGHLAAVGSYSIPDADPSHARFFIEIHFPNNYPDDLPDVCEVGGRIPRTPARHVNDDGTACLMVPEEWLVTAEDTSFPAFMTGPVKNFFVGQSLVELGQPWPYGERSHGYAGVIEAFSEILGTVDLASMRTYLAYLQRPAIKGHWACPCGSGEVLRRCHLDHLRGLQRKVTPKLATRMMARLKR